MRGSSVRTVWFLLLYGLNLTPLACTTTRYIFHVACGEAKILLSQRKVEEVIGDPRFPPESRERLLLILKTADSAEKVLGLKRTRQYRTYADLETTFTVWVLTLAEPDHLKLITFSFPIAGEVPYLGFFDLRMVELVTAQYPSADRYLRQAGAFSTLGYLPDPILPNFLTMKPEEVIRTVVHELVHATVFRIGDATWSESVAMSLGDAGSAILMEQWGMVEPLERLEKKREDERRFNELIEGVIGDLEDFYKRTEDPGERLAYKERRLEAFRKALKETPWKILRYDRYAEEPINHAFLLAHRVYAGDPAVQEQWYQSARKDYKRTLRILSERASKGESLWDPIPPP